MSISLCSKAATLVAALQVIAVLFHNLMLGCCKLPVHICTNTTTDLHCKSAVHFCRKFNCTCTDLHCRTLQLLACTVRRMKKMFPARFRVELQDLGLNCKI